MTASWKPIVNLQMLFRVPVERLFDAFVNPTITTQFWFTHSSGPLEVGRDVLWEWRMYGVSSHVHVCDLEPNRRIVMEWGDESRRSTVEWKFESRPNGDSLVKVSNFGFAGSTEEMAREAIDMSGGFALVLANAKAFLEHGVALNLIFDRFPDGHVENDHSSASTRDSSQ